MHDDDKDALAAEYVLGTLDADERNQAEAMLSMDPSFAAAVRQWERRLGELNVMVEAVEPPPQIWDRIKADIGNVVGDQSFTLPPSEPALDKMAMPPELPGSGETALDEIAAASLVPSAGVPPSIPPSLPPSIPPIEPAGRLAAQLAPMPPPPRIERGADVIVLRRRVRRWRRVTLAMTAIAALLAAFIAVAEFAPDLIPPRFLPAELIARSGPPAGPPPGNQLVAVLQQEPTAPAFLLTVDTQNRTMTVRRVSAKPETARSYELWLISSRFAAPRSLGVVGNDEFTQRSIPANFDVDTVRAARYAISLEPAGGSPSGAPTGPILFTGRLVDSVPAPQPSPLPRT